MSESFGDILYMVERACTRFSGSSPTNADILQAATQIYIAQMKEETIREINLKEERNEN